MRKFMMAAAAALALAAGTPASAAITVTFESISTPSGVTGGFTAVLSTLPLTYDYIDPAWISSCTLSSGDCGSLIFYRAGAGGVTNDGGGGPDQWNAIGGVGGLNAIFRFDAGVFETPGVYDTVSGWTNVGQVTVTGTLDGPPTDWSPTGGIPEPRTWALMLLGFGGAGWMLRRRSLSAA